MSIPYLFVKKIIKIESCNLTIFSFIVLICRSGWPVGSKLCFLFSAQEKRDLPNGWLKIWSKNKICHTFWECDFFILYDVKFMWNYLKKKKKNFTHVEWAFSHSITLALSLSFLSQIALFSPFHSRSRSLTLILTFWGSMSFCKCEMNRETRWAWETVVALEKKKKNNKKEFRGHAEE